MPTTPFTSEFEARLKESVQCAQFQMSSGRVVSPFWFCCLSGNTVEVAKDPVPVIALDKVQACTCDPVTLNYSNSWSPTSTINSWDVDWGDGNTSVGAWPGTGSVSHPGGAPGCNGYELPGTYKITLTVTDLLGATGIAEIEIEILDCTDIELEVFVGCGSSGVWYTPNAGGTWTQVPGRDNVLRDVKVHDLKVNLFTLLEPIRELWAATEIGLYKTINSAGDWHKVTLPEPESGKGTPLPYALCPSKVEREEFYALVETSDGTIYIGRTTDGGGAWLYDKISSGATDVDLFAVTDKSNDQVLERNGGLWNNINKASDGSIYYWQSTVPSVYRANYAAAASGGGLFKWNPAIWQQIGISLECPIDLVERGNGDLAVIESGCCSLTFPPSCAATPYVRIYDPNDFLKSTIALPVLVDVTKYVHITDFGGEMYVSRQAVFNSDWAILRYDELTTSWITEWTPGTSIYAASYAEYDGTLFAAIIDAPLNPYATELLVRNNVAGTWGWDTISAPDDISRVHAFDGEIYVLSGSVSRKIQRRDPVGSTYIDVTTTVPNLAFDFTRFGGEWYATSHASGGGKSYVYRWDSAGSAWVKEYETAGGVVDSTGLVEKQMAIEQTSAVAFQIPDEGRMHLMDMDYFGEYVFVCLLDASGDPIAIRYKYDLSDSDEIESGGGTWVGVVCDYYDPAIVWLFGDISSTEKVLGSEDFGDTFTNVTDAGWGATELVRPLMLNFWIGGDALAVLNNDLSVYQTKSYGAAWAKRGDTQFDVQSGFRDYVDERIYLIGRTDSGADHLRLSIDEGASDREASGSITPLAPITSIQIVG